MSSFDAAAPGVLSATSAGAQASRINGAKSPKALQVEREDVPLVDTCDTAPCPLPC